MTHNPNTDNINQNTGDYYLVFHGNDDESVHGRNTFENLYANNYSSYELNQTRSDQDESNSEESNSEESNSEESKADQKNSDQEESKADQENSNQEQSNTDESIADQENLDQDSSSYENKVDRSIRFDEEDDDDVIVDGAYLSNELQILVGCWYNDFKRVPLKWRLVYILLLIFFTRLCFLEYRVYNLSRQTKMDMDVCKDFFNRSFASRDNELRKYIDMRITDQVCPNVPTVQNPKKHHGRHHGPKIHRK